MSRPKRVEQLDKKTGTVIATHLSVHAAARSIGVPPGNICNCLRGKLKSAYGFRWRYIEDEDDEQDEQQQDAANAVDDADHIHPSYLAAFFDGDGSINISKVGPDGKQGYLLKAEISQCNQDFLKRVQRSVGNTGKLYADKRTDKYTGETSWCLRWCGKGTRPILRIILDYGVIKKEQAKLALEMLALPRVGSGSRKEEIRLKMKELNRDKTTYDKPWERVNDAYVAGLFDAEGNVYQKIDDTGKLRSYVKITQKSDPRVLHHIRDHLGCGVVKEGCRFKMYSQDTYKKFHDAVAPYCSLKLDKLKTLL